MRWFGAFVVTALFAAAQPDEVRVSARAYTPTPLRLVVQSDLVQIEVVVREAHGQSAGGLQQGDFELLDEGKHREITAFTVSTRGGAASSTPERSTLLL